MAALPTLTAEAVEASKDSIEDSFADLKASEEAYKKKNGKYEQAKPVESDGVRQEVHEYVCPNGAVGYQVMLTADLEGKRMSCSFGEGQEAEDRSFGWVEVKETEL